MNWQQLGARTSSKSIYLLEACRGKCRGLWVGLALMSMVTASCDDRKHLNRSFSSWMYDLDSEDDYKRRAACEAMAAFGPQAEEAIPKLIALLEDVNPGVQSFCEVALVKAGPAATPHLEKVLKRPEPELRLHAAAALLGIDPGHDEGGSILAKAATGVGNAEIAQQAQQRLIRVGEPGVELLLPYLDDPYAPVRLQVIKTLGKAEAKGRKAVPQLAKIAKGADSKEERLAALSSLARVGTQDELEPLFKGLLEDQDEDVAANAGALLQYIGSRKSASGNDEAEHADPKLNK